MFNNAAHTPEITLLASGVRLLWCEIRHLAALHLLQSTKQQFLLALWKLHVFLKNVILLDVNAAGVKGFIYANEL